MTTKGRKLLAALRSPAGVSFAEVLVTRLLSNVPVFVLVFVTALTTTGKTLAAGDVIDLLASRIEPAEVFVYVCVILAPILWVMAVNWRARTHYWWFLVLLVLQILTLFSTGIIWALHKNQATLNADVVQWSATTAYVAVMLIWYVTTYFRRAHLEVLGEEKKRESGSKVVSGLEAFDREQ